MKAKKFKLEIDLSNDAFQPEACIEIARILRPIACGLEDQGEPQCGQGHEIYDDNGNYVGEWIIEEVLMKYEVTLARRVYGAIEVEAASAPEAEDKVRALLDAEQAEVDESFEPGDWEILYAYREEDES